MTDFAWERIYELKKDGVTIFPKAIDLGRVKRLYDALQGCIDVDKKNYNKSIPAVDQYMVHSLMFRGQEFLDVLENEVMNKFLAEFLAPTFTIYAYQSSSMPPTGTNYSNRIHVDCPRLIQNYATNMGVIFPLVDFKKENGAPLYLKGSHLFEDAPSEEYFMRTASTIECKAGDLIMFNARAYHRGGINTTNEFRHALTINFCRAFMKQRFNFPMMTPKDMEEKLTPIQRRLLGFNARTPKSLEEYYVPEKERLYQPNQG